MVLKATDVDRILANVQNLGSREDACTAIFTATLSLHKVILDNFVTLCISKLPDSEIERINRLISDGNFALSTGELIKPDFEYMENFPDTLTRNIKPDAWIWSESPIAAVKENWYGGLAAPAGIEQAYKELLHIFIESKLLMGVNRNQTQGYQELQKVFGVNCLLVHIGTRVENTWQHPEKCMISFTWDDILRFLKVFLEENKTNEIGRSISEKVGEHVSLLTRRLNPMSTPDRWRTDFLNQLKGTYPSLNQLLNTRVPKCTGLGDWDIIKEDCDELSRFIGQNLREMQFSHIKVSSLLTRLSAYYIGFYSTSSSNSNHTVSLELWTKDGSRFVKGIFFQNILAGQEEWLSALLGIGSELMPPTENE